MPEYLPEYLAHREDADEDGNGLETFPQAVDAEREACNGSEFIRTDDGQEESEGSCDQAFQRTFSRYGADDAEAGQDHPEIFGRAEFECERGQRDDAGYKQQDADRSADKPGVKGSKKAPCRPCLSGSFHSRPGLWRRWMPYRAS